MSAEREVKSANSSIFTIDFLLAVALIAAHSTFTYNVYYSHSKPTELQQLNPYLPIAGTLLYGAMIYFGKKLMANRRAENPKSAMLLYNIYQSGINGFMALWLVVGAYRAGFSVWGNPEDRTAAGYDIAFGLWMHYNNKYLELFDTFFMVIKKKDEQISFLHVYHHILLVWSWYACILFCIGGDGYFGSAFNSLVHFFMYGYYALALCKVPCPWKKHLTMFQMVQFVCCAAQSCYVFYKGNLWWPVPALQLFVMLNMLVLFSRFYAKKYKKPAAAPGGKVAAAAAKPLDTSAAFEFGSSAAGAERTTSPSPTFSTALVNEVERSASPAVVVPETEAAAEPQQQEDQEEEVVVAKKSSSKKKTSTKKRSKKAE